MAKPDIVILDKFLKTLEIQKSLRLPAVLALGLFMYIGLSSSQEIFGIPKHPIFFGCLVIIPSIIIFHYFNWRCPACSKYLGRINPQLHKCPHCTVILQDKSTLHQPEDK
tara:strand:- start:3620 stop:3949 length:330 start_codon:yes stop_codon:yes gene_type:complete